MYFTARCFLYNSKFISPYTHLEMAQWLVSAFSTSHIHFSLTLAVGVDYVLKAHAFIIARISRTWVNSKTFGGGLSGGGAKSCTKNQLHQKAAQNLVTNNPDADKVHALRG
jgi:hypothetical protein